MARSDQLSSRPTDDRADLRCQRSQRLDEYKVIIFAIGQATALILAVIGLVTLLGLIVVLAFAYPDRVSGIGVAISGLVSFVIMNHKQVGELVNKAKAKLSNGNKS